jgi:hypothetical protein
LEVIRKYARKEHEAGREGSNSRITSALWGEGVGFGRMHAKVFDLVVVVVEMEFEKYNQQERTQGRCYF